MPQSKAIFLDRDGTLIKEFAHTPDEVHLLPGVVEGLKSLHDAGYLLIVVSNQGDVGRGKLPLEMFYLIHDVFIKKLSKAGVHLTGAYYCYHSPEEGCMCRKPKPGLLIRAQHAHDIDMSRSWMLGDRVTDLEAGVAAHLNVYYVGGEGDFTDAVSLIRSLT